MGLYAKILKQEEPRVPVHVWPKLFEQWKRSRVLLTTMVDQYTLTDKTQDIAQVFTGTNKIGIAVSHTWANDDWVYLLTTGTLPAPLALDTAYFVINSNPTEGSIKLSTTKAGAEIDITTEGTGTHTLKRIDADVLHYEETRKGITNADAATQKLARMLWDEKVEGIGEVAEEEIDHTTVADFKTELEAAATFLTV